MSFRRVLGRTVDLIDLPFGYTLTVWSSGRVALYRFGLPSILHIFYFVFAAIAAYLIGAEISTRREGEVRRVRSQAITLINVFAVVAAAAVTLVSHLTNNSALGYAAAGFVGTFTYILSISTLMWLAQRLRGQSSGED